MTTAMMTCFTALVSFDTGGSKYIVGLIDRSGEVLGTRRGVWNELTPA